MTGSITRPITFGFCAFLVAALGGCGPDYSPNTYSSAAMQQANKVDTGVVVGYREVKISSDGTVGAVTGGAAGGILGAELDSPSVPTALAALGGTVVGGVVGTTLAHATGDTTGWEYIVREPKGDLVSVTQREPKPIPIGQKVLVIEGKQARIVPDYATAAFDSSPDAKADHKAAQDKPTPDKPAAAAATNATATPLAAGKAPDKSGAPSDQANAESATASGASGAAPATTPDAAPATAPSEPQPTADAPAASPAATDSPAPAAAGSDDKAPPPPS